MSRIHQLCQKKFFHLHQSSLHSPQGVLTHFSAVQACSPRGYTLTIVLLRFTRHHFEGIPFEKPLENAHVSRSPGSHQTLARS